MTIKFIAYNVEVDERACPTCDRGKKYRVFGPDGVGDSASYENLEDAEAFADALNDAFRKGMESVK